MSAAVYNRAVKMNLWVATIFLCICVGNVAQYIVMGIVGSYSSEETLRSRRFKRSSCSHDTPPNFFFGVYQKLYAVCHGGSTCGVNSILWESGSLPKLFAREDGS